MNGFDASSPRQKLRPRDQPYTMSCVASVAGLISHVGEQRVWRAVETPNDWARTCPQRETYLRDRQKRKQRLGPTTIAMANETVNCAKRLVAADGMTLHPITQIRFAFQGIRRPQLIPLPM